MSKQTSDPLELPDFDEGEEFARADLVFYGVDHSGPSFQGHVFLNNPDAGLDTARELDEGYAGAFTVFGHNGCYGDEGHCLPDGRTTDVFDLRAPHPLRPLTLRVIATDAVKRAIAERGVDEVTVTVVAAVPEDDFPSAGPEPPHFEYVRLVTYED